jgi:hypothetical protein
LVEERTDQLREEKKKTEDILLQMLPQWVLIVVLHFSNFYCFSAHLQRTW